MNEKSSGRKKLIIYSTSFWESPLKFRRHQFALIASQYDFDVYYFYPTFTILSFFKEADCRNIFFDFFKNPKEVNRYLKVFTMPPLFPFQKKVHFINILNKVVSKFIISWILRRRNCENGCVFIVYEPTDLYRIIRNENSVIVYECVDEHSEYPFNFRIKDKIIELEKKLIEKSDLITFTSNYLLEKKKGTHSNFLLIPNGVDFNLFNSALSKNTVIPFDIENISPPVILYVGAIMEWFDFDLLIKISKYNRSWNIVLIGPQTVNLGLFKSYSNIHHLGVIKQSDLVGYLKKSAVCIIPFLINDLVRGVNPLKLYEYLASGKPVVSTPLPDVIPFEKINIVHIGKNHDEFISHLDYLIAHVSNEEFIGHRVELARSYSWENIYRTLSARIKLLYK